MHLMRPSGTTARSILAGATMSRSKAALFELLKSLFDVGEFRRLLRFDADAEVLDEVPADNPTPSEFFAAALDELIRRGAVDESFFARLRAERPKRIKDIDAVAALWKDGEGSSPAPGRRNWRIVVLLGAVVTLAATALVLVLRGGTRSREVPAPPPSAPPTPAPIAVAEPSEPPIAPALPDEPTRESPQTAPSPDCPDDMVLVPGTRGRSFLRAGEERVVADFCMDVTEVTVEAFLAPPPTPESPEQRKKREKERKKSETVRMAGDDRDEYCNLRHPDRRRHPINCVDFAQASDHCARLEKRLPTEWEWEWAATGGHPDRTYPWGSSEPNCELAIMANSARVIGCGEERTWEVAQKPAFEGLNDMLGNVWEWTSSRSADQQVVRGGCWSNDPLNAKEDDPDERDPYAEEYLKVSYRDQRWAPGVRSSKIGFRCAAATRRPAGA